MGAVGVVEETPEAMNSLVSELAGVSQTDGQIWETAGAIIAGEVNGGICR